MGVGSQNHLLEPSSKILVYVDPLDEMQGSAFIALQRDLGGYKGLGFKGLVSKVWGLQGQLGLASWAWACR